MEAGGLSSTGGKRGGRNDTVGAGIRVSNNQLSQEMEKGDWLEAYVGGEGLFRS